MTFERKAYDKMLKWKRESDGKSALLIEGARRVGKTTLATEFSKNEYESSILIDFSKASASVKRIFDDISDLDMFFMRLKDAFKTKLIKRKSAIVFDEVQLFPPARQSIKHLVADGRYDYIETGSFVSIRKNVRNILIPSEEDKLKIRQLDFEEFLNATALADFDTIAELYETGKPVGTAVHKHLMKCLNLYLAIGGMPQAVNEFIENADFARIDKIKRSIVELYEDDFRKIDPSGRIGKLYSSVPSQLALNKRRFMLSNATRKKITRKDTELLYDLLDSQTVLMCCRTTNPDFFLRQTADFDSYKLYMADTGLFASILFGSKSKAFDDTYTRLAEGKLPANLGFLYENLAACMITASGNDLCYCSWPKENSTHSYEVDFLIPDGIKTSPMEIKSGQIKNHSSIDACAAKFKKQCGRKYLFSKYDVRKDGDLQTLPFYFLPLVLRERL
ncbi:MAG TPA: ATPase [Spirochaetaceae bacterium]|nr:ATPase [Spirochaetaceae bacterium]